MLASVRFAEQQSEVERKPLLRKEHGLWPNLSKSVGMQNNDKFARALTKILQLLFPLMLVANIQCSLAEITLVPAPLVNFNIVTML